MKNTGLWRNRMGFIKTVLLTWLVMVQKSLSLICPPVPQFNRDNCVCDHRTSSDRTGGWEMACFRDGIQEHSFIIDYAVNRHLLVECGSVISPYASSMFSTFNSTEIATFEFRSCLLPNVSFSAVLRGQNVYSLTFESRMNATTLTHKHLEGLKELKVLVLKRNGLSILPHNIFQNLSQLKDLRLNDNNLQIISEDSFNGLLELSNLELGDNIIQELPEKVFSQLLNLKYLYLYKNKLKNVPSKIFHPLQSLVTLDLSNNLIQEIPVKLLEDLHNLERISLRGNSLKTLPLGVFWSNTLLLELDLSNNPHLRDLPETLFSGLSELRHLNMDNCNISWVPKRLFSSLINLQKLKMSYNRITKLHPDVFYENINLMVLLLDANYLETLPDNLFQRQYFLTMLGLLKNNLQELPSGVFRNLVRLTELNMAFNNISHLNWDALTSLQHLETLSLRNNRLQYISNFGLSSNLKKVDLSHNLLTFMPEIKEGVHMKIQEINLEYNNISFLDVPLVLSDAAIVRLGWNNITFLRIDNLALLYNVNQLSEPDPSSQNSILKNSPRFYIFPNPIRCDCQIYNFVSYITTKKNQHSDQVPLAAFPFSQNLVCDQPSHLRGKKLSDLPTSDLFCPTTGNCPSSCSCYKKIQGNELVMNCSYRGLEKLPSIAPWNTSILIFSGNKLHSLDDLNEPIWDNLIELHLDDNLLSDFGAWNFKQNLTYISLQRNAFSHLPMEFMRYVSGNYELKVSLGHNPWTCGCSITEMKGWLIENFQKMNDINNIFCEDETNGNIGDVNVLKASKKVLCTEDTWPHKSQLIIVCILVVTIPFLVFVTLVLYYRNRKNLKAILSAKSRFLHREIWLQKRIGCIINCKRKTTKEVPSQVGLNSKATNSSLLTFVEDTISSLSSVPGSRSQDKQVEDGTPAKHLSCTESKSTNCDIPKYDIV